MIKNGEIEDDNFKAEIAKLSETGKASCIKLQDYLVMSENSKNCEKNKAKYYYAIAFALFTQRALYAGGDEELANKIVEIFEKGRVHFSKGYKDLKDTFESNSIHNNSHLEVSFEYAKNVLDDRLNDNYKNNLQTLLKGASSDIRYMKFTNEPGFRNKVMSWLQVDTSSSMGGRKNRSRRNRKSRRR